MLLHGPAHCFNLLLRAEDCMTNHPEWFGLRNGKRVPQTFAGAQFCWSNPEARKQFTDNVGSLRPAARRRSASSASCRSTAGRPASATNARRPAPATC